MVSKSPLLHVTQLGSGRVQQEFKNDKEIWRLYLPPAVDNSRGYHDAQIATYRTRQDFQYQPGTRLQLTAYAEGDLQGTAGFGFWNHPFVPGERGVRLPKALWFFFSAPPSNMRLAYGVDGSGWKAATFDATRWQFLALLPTAPLGFLLMKIPTWYRQLWPIGQRALAVQEAMLDSALLRTERTYTLEWRAEGIQFMVDNVPVLNAAVQINGTLGFIAWVDNQYAIVTPQGHFRMGTVPVNNPQTLVLRDISISSLA